MKQKELKILALVPPAYLWLQEKARFKVCYGGRGAGRSWSFARYLICRALQSKIRILCTREIQNSILESVHATLKGQIELLGLDQHFTINDRSIICNSTGSEFFFMGLYRNVSKIKSLYDFNAIGRSSIDIHA